MVAQTFEWKDGGEQVIVTGDFANWEQTLVAEKGDDGVFRAIIDRPAGTKILFKFVVDGEWKNASNYEEETDDSGNTNNVYIFTEEVNPVGAEQNEKGVATPPAEKAVKAYKNTKDTVDKTLHQVEDTLTKVVTATVGTVAGTASKVVAATEHVVEAAAHKAADVAGQAVNTAAAAVGAKPIVSTSVKTEPKEISVSKEEPIAEPKQTEESTGRTKITEKEVEAPAESAPITVPSEVATDVTVEEKQKEEPVAEAKPAETIKEVGVTAESVPVTVPQEATSDDKQKSVAVPETKPVEEEKQLVPAPISEKQGIPAVQPVIEQPVEPAAVEATEEPKAVRETEEPKAVDTQGPKVEDIVTAEVLVPPVTNLGVAPVEVTVPETEAAIKIEEAPQETIPETTSAAEDVPKSAISDVAEGAAAVVHPTAAPVNEIIPVTAPVLAEPKIEPFEVAFPSAEDLKIVEPASASTDKNISPVSSDALEKLRASAVDVTKDAEPRTQEAVASTTVAEKTPEQPVKEEAASPAPVAKEEAAEAPKEAKAAEPRKSESGASTGSHKKKHGFWKKFKGLFK